MKKSSAEQNCYRKIGFDYMPLSHFGYIKSFSGLPLLADTLPGHLRFRPFALFPRQATRQVFLDKCHSVNLRRSPLQTRIILQTR